MFRVCATFNPLFSRPRIRETVAEFQERLIEVVRRDLDALTERFKTSGAARAQAALLSRLRGVADVASTVRWARQLEGRLNAHMSNLQAVLGGREACADHAEGQRLLHAAEAFRAKLSSRALLDEWRREAKRVADDFDPSATVLLVRASETDGSLSIGVSFSAETARLLGETRSLARLGVPIPEAVSRSCAEAQLVQHHAASLSASLASFARVCASLSEDADYLLRGARGEVQALLTYAAKAPVCWATQADGAGAAAWDGSVRWDVRVIESFAQQLATTVSTLESRALTLEKKLRQLEANISELATCEYTADSFAARLKPVQAILDELELGNYSNVAQVAEELAERVADALRRRLEIALRRWAAAFPTDEGDGGGLLRRPGGQAPELLRILLGGEVFDADASEIIDADAAAAAEADMQGAPPTPRPRERVHTMSLDGVRGVEGSCLRRRRRAWRGARSCANAPRSSVSRCRRAPVTSTSRRPPPTARPTTARLPPTFAT